MCQPGLWGTLGTVRANGDFVDGAPAWMAYADNFIAGSMTTTRDGLLSRRADIWGFMLTLEGDDTTRCGVVLTGDDSVVRTFFEKVPDLISRQVSAATFMFESRAFKCRLQKN